MAEEAAPALEETTPAPEVAAPLDIVEEIAEVAAEAVEQAADVVESVAEEVKTVAETVIEIAKEVIEVAEVVAEEASKVEVVAEEIAEVIAPPSDEAPAEVVVAEEAAPVEIPAVEIAPAEPAPAEPAPSEPAPVELAPVAAEPPATLVEAVKSVVAPQRYADLGKDAKDLLFKDFDTVHKVKLGTSAKGGQLTGELTHNSDTGAVAGSHEFKFGCCGMSFSNKWNLDSVLSQTVSVTNQGMDGLNVDIDTSYSLISNKKSLKVKTAYIKSPLFHPTLDLDVADVANFSKPNIDFSCAVAHKGFYAGYQTSFDSAAMKLIQHNVSGGFKNDNLILHGAVENANKFLGSVYYKVKEGLSAAAHVTYTPGATPGVTLGGKYDVDETACLKVKLDNNLVLGTSWVQQIRPGVSLSTGGAINLKGLDKGGHKIGVSLNFDA